MTDRRSFIRQTAALLGTLALHPSLEAALPVRPDPDGPEEDFWRQIRLAFAASPSLTNLNNGGVSPSPRVTMDALDYYNRMCNEAPSYHMWRTLEVDREPLRYNLAALAGVSTGEIAINRNATEALNTIIFGLPLKAGDEVVLSKFDYPNMMNAWKQREQRDGIRLVWVDLQLPSEDDDAMVEAYVSKFTDRTRLVYVTHIINWTGQIVPVRKIADRAHARGIEVAVDAAHSFALLDYQIPELGADYLGTSLHKWLCGPFGSGMLYVKKEKIPTLWPLLSSDEPRGPNITKFESLGTRSFPIEVAIGYSLDFHNLIGTARKQKRLHFLKNYWMDRLRDVPGIRFYTSGKPEYGCAIGTMGLDQLPAHKIGEQLQQQWRVHVVSIEREYIKCIRVTPNVYTTTDDLDKFIYGIRALAKS